MALQAAEWLRLGMCARTTAEAPRLLTANGTDRPTDRASASDVREDLAWSKKGLIGRNSWIKTANHARLCEFLEQCSHKQVPPAGNVEVRTIEAGAEGKGGGVKTAGQ